MTNTKSILFVIAAGNDNSPLSADLTATPTLGYPARYSVELPNVMSVAAHDSSSQRACFSNYGSAVDIAAPGVDVESTVEGATAKLSGTSQAAPIVTFTAALLFSAGYSRTPEAVKNRIAVSGDFTGDLKNVVSSDSKLNIAKALAFKNDVIELSDHKLVTGTIDSPGPIFASGEARPILWRDVAKIIIPYSTTPGKRNQVTVFQNGKLARFTLDLPWTEISGKDESGRPFKYELSMILDIVPSGAG
jgi:subtilisin family serine protease